MSFKGTAGKSSSGASMSKYDVEVEARLQKLEGAISSIEGMVSALEGAVDRCKVACAENSHTHESAGGSGDLQNVINALRSEFPGHFGDNGEHPL